MKKIVLSTVAVLLLTSQAEAQKNLENSESKIAELNAQMADQINKVKINE